jgi:hypothetical protein
MYYVVLYLALLSFGAFFGLAVRRPRLRRWRYLILSVLLQGSLVAATVGFYRGADEAFIIVLVLVPAELAGIAVSLPYVRKRIPD